MVFERMALRSFSWAAMGLALAGVASGQEVGVDAAADVGADAAADAAADLNTQNAQDKANAAANPDAPAANVGVNAGANADANRIGANAGVQTNEARAGAGLNADGTRTDAQINADGTRSRLQLDGNNRASGATNNIDVNGRSTLDANSGININGSQNRDNYYGDESASGRVSHSVGRPIYGVSDSMSLDGQANGVVNYGQSGIDGCCHGGSSGYYSGNFHGGRGCDPCRHHHGRRVRHGRWCR